MLHHVPMPDGCSLRRCGASVRHLPAIARLASRKTLRVIVELLQQGYPHTIEPITWRDLHSMRKEADDPHTIGDCHPVVLATA